MAKGQATERREKREVSESASPTHTTGSRSRERDLVACLFLSPLFQHQNIHRLTLRVDEKKLSAASFTLIFI
jgi:hypothetical protein